MDQAASTLSLIFFPKNSSAGCFAAKEKDPNDRGSPSF